MRVILVVNVSFSLHSHCDYYFLNYTNICTGTSLFPLLPDLLIMLSLLPHLGITQSRPLKSQTTAACNTRDVYTIESPSHYKTFVVSTRQGDVRVYGSRSHVNM